MNANGTSHPRRSVILHSPLGMMTSIFAAQPFLLHVFYFNCGRDDRKLGGKCYSYSMVHAQDACFHFRPTRWWLPEALEGNEYVFGA